MKTSRIALLAGLVPAFVVLFNLQPLARAQCVAPPSGLVAWWTGDDNTTDIIGGHNGTLVNQATYAPGEVADAFSFDGSSDYVEVPSASAFEFGPTLPFSFAFWAFRTSDAHDMHMLGKRATCDPAPYTYQVLWYTDGAVAWGSPTLGVYTDTNDLFPINTWTHIAATYDYDDDSGTGTGRIYINGQFHGESTGLVGPTNSYPLRIGTSDDCESFAGQIDETQIYNRALTQAEIQGIFDAGANGNCKTPVASTWKANPQSGDWNTAANWTTNRVPGPLDTVRFRASAVTAVSTSADVQVASISFPLGASAYTITNSQTMTVSGAGVKNSSGLTQNILVDGPYSFTNSASAGNLTSYTVNGGGVSAPPGTLVFADSSKAASATLTAGGGVLPGTIQFLGSSTGGTARVVVNGGNFDISSHNAPGVTVGSIEGASGSALLGGNKLTVGTNGMSTSFNGEILGDLLNSNAVDAHGGTPAVASRDGTAPVPPKSDSPLAGGSLAKVGTGTLILGGANTYTGGTTVSAGGLFLQQNGNSSQTGPGNVNVSAGTLGGDGTAAGNVNIGNNSGPRATLAPGFSDEILSTFFTAKKKLTFKSDGDFVCEFDSGQVLADKVQARGVAISPGATFSFSEVGTGTMQIGTTFILINNTAQTPISGTFTGVPEGAEIVFGNYLWRFSYLGGNGNDFSGEILEDL